MKAFIYSSILLCLLSSPVYSLFYDFENPAQEKDWQIFAGKGYIKDGKYYIERTNATDAIAAIGDMTWTDCVVTCKATMLDGSTDNMGLVWRLKDGKTFYVISVRMDQRVGYCACIDGAWMNGGAPINPKPFNTKLNKEYHFKLVVTGNKFQFFLDGEDMGTWEESQLKTGLVGIRTWNASMAVDDFDINGPGIQRTAVACKDKLVTEWAWIKMLL